jgi:hypothetical protein
MSVGRRKCVKRNKTIATRFCVSDGSDVTPRPTVGDDWGGAVRNFILAITAALALFASVASSRSALNPK